MRGKGIGSADRPVGASRGQSEQGAIRMAGKVSGPKQAGRAGFLAHVSKRQGQHRYYRCYRTALFWRTIPPHCPRFAPRAAGRDQSRRVRQLDQRLRDIRVTPHSASQSRPDALRTGQKAGIGGGTSGNAARLREIPPFCAYALVQYAAQNRLLLASDNVGGVDVDLCILDHVSDGIEIVDHRHGPLKICEFASSADDGAGPC
jgi:hypothetical protein